MYAATLTIVSILLGACVVQLCIQFWFERPFTTLRKARMVLYALMVFTLAYRLGLYIGGHALVTPVGLGIGTTSTLVMIILEYIRTREARGL
jgi:hypothetical protein